MLNVRTIIRQNLKIKELKLLKLQITHTSYHLSILNGKIFKFKTPKMKKKSNVHK